MVPNVSPERSETEKNTTFCFVAKEKPFQSTAIEEREVRDIAASCVRAMITEQVFRTIRRRYVICEALNFPTAHKTKSIMSSASGLSGK